MSVPLTIPIDARSHELTPFAVNYPFINAIAGAQIPENIDNVIPIPSDANRLVISSNVTYFCGFRNTPILLDAFGGFEPLDVLCRPGGIATVIEIDSALPFHVLLRNGPGLAVICASVEFYK